MNICQIKKYFLNNIGMKITVIYNGTRNKRERYSGYLRKVYNNIFLIETDNNSIKSFNYVDIITKVITIYV